MRAGTSHTTGGLGVSGWVGPSCELLQRAVHHFPVYYAIVRTSSGHEKTPRDEIPGRFSQLRCAFVALA
jgi:hypothetical protein